MKIFALIAFVCLNLAFGGNKFEILRLSEFDGRDVSGYLVSEKLDGVRAYWDGENLLSRKGKKINAPANFIALLPPFAIDGELYTKRGEFEKIQSIVMDKTPDIRAWEEIRFYIFDLPDESGGLMHRLKRLSIYLAKNPAASERIKVINQVKLRDNAHLDEFLDDVLSNGGEGVVIRHANAAYERKRSKNAMKYKKFQDAECVVVAINEGSGKFKGKLGSISCQNDDKRVFKIGSGFSDKDRENPPQIGDVIRYKFQNLTSNKLPRFPVFMGVRRD